MKFNTLCQYLGLVNTADSISTPSSEALDWLTDPHSLVKGWLGFLMTCKDRKNVRVCALLIKPSYTKSCT